MRENLALTDWELGEEHMATLDGLTTPAALETFAALYRKCVTRDTPLDPALARETLTVD